MLPGWRVAVRHWLVVLMVGTWLSRHAIRPWAGAVQRLGISRPPPPSRLPPPAPSGPAWPPPDLRAAAEPSPAVHAAAELPSPASRAVSSPAQRRAPQGGVASILCTCQPVLFQPPWGKLSGSQPPAQLSKKQAFPGGEHVRSMVLSVYANQTPLNDVIIVIFLSCA